MLTIAVATLLMSLGPMLNRQHTLQSRGVSDIQWRLLFDLLPQSLAIAIPIGLAIGLAIGLGGRVVTLRLAGLALCLTTVFWFGSVGTMAWLAPRANTAFFVDLASLVEGRRVQLTDAWNMSADRLRQAGELSARARFLQPGAHVYSATFAQRAREARACASPALAMFVLALASRRQFRRSRLTVMASLAVLGYVLLISVGEVLGRLDELSAVAAAWLPNATFMFMSTALLVLVRRINAEP
jgi:hypothetical protein